MIMNATEGPSNPSTLPRRGFQCGLRTMMLFVAGTALVLRAYKGLDGYRTKRWIDTESRASQRIVDILVANGIEDFTGVRLHGVFCFQLSSRDLEKARYALIDDAKGKGYWLTFRGYDLLHRVRTDFEINQWKAERIGDRKL